MHRVNRHQHHCGKTDQYHFFCISEVSCPDQGSTR